MSQLQQSKQTRQLLAFDTTMAGVSSTNTSSDKGTTRKFIKGSDRGTSPWRRTLSSSSISLGDYSILLCVKLDRTILLPCPRTPRARCTTNLVLWLSAPEPPSAGSGLNSSGNSMPRSTAIFSRTAPGNRQERAYCSLDNDCTLQGTHTEWARKDPQATTLTSSVSACGTRLYRFPLKLAMRAAESHGHRVPFRHFAETKRSVHRTFGLASQDIPTEFTYETQASVRSE